MPEVAAAPLIDANLLIWAHHAHFPHHEQTRRWWRDLLSSAALVGLPWPSILAFLRVSTHPRALERPIELDDAWHVVGGWLARPNVWVPVPTERHARVLEPLLLGARAAGNHTTDAHLAALAVEWGLELLSADRGFARFSGLHWRDPLAGL